MGIFLKFLIVLVAVSVGVYIKLNQESPLPHLRDDEWWGPGSPLDSPKVEDTSIRPFTINISDEVLSDLQSRLKKHRPLTPPLEGIQQQYGINTKLVEKIANFWTTKYNWREREKYLNQYSHFKTKIQGLDIHFLHIKPKNVPKGTKVLPLLLLHGWPGSFVEFYGIIPLLTTPIKGYNFVFEVIVPSMPGYGFSQATTKPGLSSKKISVIYNNLMKRLGFDTYYAQGGDWGSNVATNIAKFYPNNTKGIHLNMCFSNKPISRLKWLVGTIYPEFVVSKEKVSKLYPISKFISTLFLEFGYMHVQATKPDTIGVALTDSPIGLAAYILEKFTTWTNPAWKELEDGGLEKKFTLEQLLDNVMIYWVTNSITTSMRIYSESINSEQNAFEESQTVHVPTGCSNFEYELVYHPEHFIKDTFVKLVHYREHSDGGHFAAMELPKVLAVDVWDTINKIESSPPPSSPNK